MADRAVETGPEGFADLVLGGGPLLDVRAEIEFNRGAFPGSVNLPILKTNEREQVGLCYKEHGQAAAIELGNTLVAGQIRELRIDAWCALAERHPDLHLYCWRGGLRSSMAQQWLAERGYQVPRIVGGFKALRSFLLEQIDENTRSATLLRIGGRTGSGKTALLKAIGHGIDLEHHANHRGSSFGRRVTPSPVQIDFENALAIQFMECRRLRPNWPVLVEDEGGSIGRVSIPKALFEHMKAADMAVIEMPLEQRVDNVLTEYVLNLRREYETADPETGFEAFSAHLLDSLERIRKRLGAEHYLQAREIMEQALLQQRDSGLVTLHCQWIELLLGLYYDRMYDYQLRQNTEQIVFRGSWEEVKTYLESRL